MQAPHVRTGDELVDDQRWGGWGWGREPPVPGDDAAQQGGTAMNAAAGKARGRLGGVNRLLEPVGVCLRASTRRQALLSCRLPHLC